VRPRWPADHITPYREDYAVTAAHLLSLSFDFTEFGKTYNTQF
jgi:hypothetical protein